ncbi:VENN motif pre-toxin domain-containing protein [Proteus sp. ZN5]|uniref:VENN motif pre-toxin domain-containing protein n=1 Tax=Proteus sp. ZN5 TaxID=2697019 RepID=UPI0013E12F6D|nr:VENN motif pre-toxin domain-containing protein [Proteus sp. ZN5]QIG06540.1 hypothetical protein GTK47_14855 [Proteus sp. ZN5]
MGNNIVTAIANGSAPYLANEVKNQIQGNSVESDIQRTIAHGLLNAGLALAKGENAVVQASGAMTGETVGILSHSLYGKTPEELTETEKQNISAWATLTSGIVGGLISDNSTGVANAAQAGKVVVENNFLGDISREALDKNREALRENKYTERDVRELLALEARDQINDELLNQYRKDPASLTPEQQQRFLQELQQYAYEKTHLHDTKTVEQLVIMLLKEGDSSLLSNKGFPYAGRTEAKNAWADKERQRAYEQNGWLGALNWTRTQTEEEKLFRKADNLANTYGYHRDNAAIGDAPLQVLQGGLTIRVMAPLLGGAGKATAYLLGDGTGKMMLTTGTIGATANAGIQYGFTGEINSVDVVFAFGTGAMTAYTKLGGTVAWNAGMGGAASMFKGDDPFTILTNATTAGIGSSVGYGFAGKPISYGWNQYKLWKTGGWDPKYNPKLQGGAIKGLYGLSKDMKPHPLPGILGNIGSAFTTETTNFLMQEKIKEVEEKNSESKN